jgi:hypothetical protein
LIGAVGVDGKIEKRPPVDEAKVKSEAGRLVPLEEAKEKRLAAQKRILDEASRVAPLLIEISDAGRVREILDRKLGRILVELNRNDF